MASAASSSPYPQSGFHLKPHVRQEGFHLPSPEDTTNSGDTPSPQTHTGDNIFGIPYNAGNSGSSGNNNNNVDFNDELASLMNNNPPSSNERTTTTHSPTSRTSSYNDAEQYRPNTTHNIFDISAPHHFSLPSSNNNNNNTNNSSGTPDPPPYHFNSTLPALNSSMRYDPHPPPPPSSSSAFRSPSPGRSRSRSRPPSAHPQSPLLVGSAGGGGGAGPHRTTRARRNNSMSSTSPPPRPVPQAIVIPGGGGAGGASAGRYGSWFGVNGEYTHHTPTESLPSLTSLPSLPSLNSLNSPHGLNSPGPHNGGGLASSPHGGMHSPHGHGSLNSPHGLNSNNGLGSPHLGALGIPHGMHMHNAHQLYGHSASYGTAPGSYGSPDSAAAHNAGKFDPKFGLSLERLNLDRLGALGVNGLDRINGVGVGVWVRRWSSCTMGRSSRCLRAGRRFRGGAPCASLQ